MLSDGASVAAPQVDADTAKLEAFRLKDRIEELAYRLNGLATNK